MGKQLSNHPCVTCELMIEKLRRENATPKASEEEPPKTRERSMRDLKAERARLSQHWEVLGSRIENI